MSVPLFTFGRRLNGIRRDSANSFRDGSDLEALLFRLRQRLYPETMPVLAFYWLKTVCASGHDRKWWKRLDQQLKRVLTDEEFDPAAAEALTSIRTWIRQAVFLTGKTPEAVVRRIQPFRAKLDPEWLAPYVVRLLNEWLPTEVASLLTNESQSEIQQQEEGIPVLAAARALERLLIREHLSPGSLEVLLDAELLAPRYVYPAEAEILRDVVLAMLGRTWAPQCSFRSGTVMPATLLAVARESSLPSDYRNAVRGAFLVRCGGLEELHVPIAAEQGREILKQDRMRIGSILVTMDGRWWETGKLQVGADYVIVYTPGARLKIDYSADHAKLVVPWPQMELRWSGEFPFRDSFEIFGREWHAAGCEIDGDRTWLHLEFSRALKADTCLPRSHPASIDIAWNALESALSMALDQESTEPVEQLHCDLVPLGRALFELMASIKNQLPKRETLQSRLSAIQYFQAQTSLLHGRVPWRVLPLRVRERFLKARIDGALLELLIQVFDELPQALATKRAEAQGSDQSSNSPFRAA